MLAWRDSDGRPAFTQEHCAHRGVSLYYGRNEESGLRCAYHGWKFDVNGACVDMPSEPAESNFKNKVRARAYACIERGGVIWTYMGTKDVPPPLPMFEANLAPETSVQKAVRACNWVQGLEGDIDTSHLYFLHLGAVKPEDTVEGSFDYYGVKDRTPRYNVIDTPFGTSYGAYRPAEADTYYWRIASFLMPCYTMIPTGTLGRVVSVRAWVPIDDENTMFWNMSVPSSRALGRNGQTNDANVQSTGRPANAAAAGNNQGGFKYLPETSDWNGKWRLTQNARNDYMIDREAQASGQNYTGIPGIFQQDASVTESMGAINNRTQEHLGTSDAMIIRTRRRLMGAARALREEGTIPPGVEEPAVYRTRTGSVVLPRNADWLEATQHARWPSDEIEIAAPVANVGV
jgi:phenylpropionate dioxygenase-like ring-hydroxylating dioxygenase large terminal subunit